MSALPLLSLLDRLIDDAPDAFDERSDEASVERMLKQGMRRDLEGLLNTKRPHLRAADQPDLSATVLGYGLPDLSTDDFSSPAVRERIRRLIIATIRTHEPRLRRIEVDNESGPTSTGIRFRISAVMMIDREEEPVVYDARLRPTDRDFAIKLAR